MKVSTITLAISVMVSRVKDWALTSNHDSHVIWSDKPTAIFQKAKRPKKRKPKNRPSRRQRVKFKRR